MKKSDFIERVAEKAEMSKSAAARTVEAIFGSAQGVIVQALRAGDDVSLPGFGKFRSKTRAPRKGRNPRTGKEIDIAERTVMQFTAGKGVADTLGGGSKGAASKAAGGGRSAGAKAAAKAGGGARAKNAGKTAGAAASGSKSAAKGAGGTAAKSAGAKTTGAKSAAKSGRRP
jgi:DNA-binding protein HU-beta